jgi:hypothetical protein
MPILVDWWISHFSLGKQKAVTLFVFILRILRASPATTRTERATHSTSKKQAKGEIQILIGLRPRGNICERKVDIRRWLSSKLCCRHFLKEVLKNFFEKNEDKF